MLASVEGLLAPSGRPMNAVEKTLQLVGLGRLGRNASYMFYPNHSSRVAGNRHYIYKTGTGWNEGTLSRGDVKYPLNASTGYLTTVAAATIDAGCLIEPSRTKLVPLFADWSFVQRATRTTGQADLLGGTSAIDLRDDNTPSDSHYIYNQITCPAGSRIAVYVYAKRNVGTRNISIVIQNAGGSCEAKFTLSGAGSVASEGKTGDGTASTDGAIVLLPSGWYRCSFTAIPSAGTANAEVYFKMTSGTNASYSGDNTSSILISNISMEVGEYPSKSWIAGAKNTVRAADALRFTSLSGLTSGGMLAMLRLQHAGSALAADQTHLCLNGSDSLDNAVRIYTEADDDKLYAEVRSGGVSQGTVDLGTYVARTQYAIALDWDATGLRGCINATEKTATGAITVPASIDRLEVGRGISTDTAHGGETPMVMLFNRVLTTAERAALTGAALKASVFGGI